MRLLTKLPHGLRGDIRTEIRTDLRADIRTQLGARPQAGTRTRLLTTALLGALAGCASAPPAQRARAKLMFKALSAETTIWLQGHAMGEAADLTQGLQITPGTWRLELRLDGHHSHYRTLVVAANTTTTIDAVLHEDLD